MSRRKPPPKTPWPFVTVAKASTMLGVDVGAVNRIAQSDRVRCVEAQDLKGRPAFFLNAEDVEALRDQMQRH